MDFKIINYPEFNDYSLIESAHVLRGHSKKLKYPDVLDIVLSFDIETSYIKSIDESVMYVWQVGISDKIVVIGRTWQEFVKFIHSLLSIAIDKNSRIIVFVHNLSYEFQFLRSILNFTKDDVFCLKKRRILTARYKDLIEFRCSYILTNMSLAEFTSKMMVEHVKLDGEEYNYDKERLPWDDMTQEEFRYCAHDVIGLNEAVLKLMESDADNLLSLPHTSTGYVRRDAREAMRKVRNGYVENMLPDYQVYKLLRQAFRGGNTHANRNYVGHILNNVYSADRSSSYPDTQINDLFPCTKFETVEPSIENLERRLNHQKALLMLVEIDNISLRYKYWGCPYIPIDKCSKLVDYVNDNGRVLKARHLEIALTDIDYKIIAQEYKWDQIHVNILLSAGYEHLPQPLVDVTIQYYKDKTSLKDVEGQEVYYTKQKNKLNSIYGMSAQDPVKQRVIVDGLEYKEEYEDPEKLLLSTRNRQFMPYQWGVWITAHARYRLEEGIVLAGDDYVYCDTDCVKSLKEVDFRSYNKERIKRSKSRGAYAVDSKGKTHYMGVFETEEKADRFITWGAKKYAYEKNGKIKVTVSGVQRKHSADELKKYGGLEAFKPGMVFIDAGGLSIAYRDHVLDEIEYAGKRLLLPSNAVIRPSTYELGITNIYEKLLDSLDNFEDLC